MNDEISGHCLCIICGKHLTDVLDWCIGCSKHLYVLYFIWLLLVIFPPTLVLLKVDYFMDAQSKFSLVLLMF
jgi:hypothetical protein